MLHSPCRYRRLTVECLESRQLLSAATIQWANPRQSIDGFGAASAWTTQDVTASQQQLLFSPADGIGMSLLRSRILPDTTASSWEIKTMQKAQAMGATDWSTPWSPPAIWKSNNNVNNGGSLLPSHYQDYANLLAQYVLNMRNNYGITISAISLQNEPDYTATTYESCTWTAAQFAAFLPYVHNVWTADGLTTKIIMPEESGWHFELANTVMNDPTLNSYVNIYAGHDYDSGSGTVPSAAGHQLWETEIYDRSENLTIADGLWVATNIYNFLVTSGANAWHYWWIHDNVGGLFGTDWQQTSRAWAMGNYSKFIRPGWVELGESDDGGMLISGFKNQTTGEFAVVMVNNSSSAITETVNLNGAYSPVVTPWVTSATLNLAPQQAIPATGNGGSYSYTVGADSIVTLDGFASTTPVTSPPVGLLATAAATSSIQLSWTNNLSGATGYTVQRSPDGTTWTTLTSSLSSSTYTYTDSSLPQNTLYYYRVIANNGTTYSNTSSAMTQPNAPSGLTASYSSSTLNVTLTWTGNSPLTDYAIDYSTDGGNTWTTRVADVASGTTNYTDTTAPDLATVMYRVRAIYGANSSVPSNTYSVTTTVLRPPASLAAAVSGVAVKLTWSDATTTSAAVSIERSTDNVNWTVLTSVAHGVQTYTDSTVSEGGTYYYRIRNYLNPTYSAYDTASSITVPPAPPTHVEVVFSPLPTLQATVVWDDNSVAATAYKVERSTNGGTSWTTLTSTLAASATSYTDANVTSGTACEYRVTALVNSITSTSVATLSETAAALPAPYYQGDIGDAGTVGSAGGATYNSSTGTYSVNGAGVDIWNTADGFHYAYTTATGDADYVAEVTSMPNVSQYGKVGIMFRNSLDPSSVYADLFVNPAPQLWAAFEHRNTYATTPSSTGGYKTYTALPIWLKLSRRGNVFTAYYGTNGTTWTQVGSSTITMGTTIDIGMVTCSHSTSVVGTGTFTNVALTNGPSVAMPAAASPATVTTGTTTNLSVLGGHIDGESTLTYTWAATGTPPAPVTFSINGTNASKNDVVTFRAAGNYQFQVTITDASGLTVTSSVSVTVSQMSQGLSINPASANITGGGSQQFAATMLDQFGQPMSPQPAVTWALASGPGSITIGGLYTPPYATGSATVQASSGSFVSMATATFATQPQWNAAASGSWNGSGNWVDVLTSNTIAAPGTRGVLGDALTFAAATGPVARLDGANPVLASIAFNNAVTSYTIAQGSGGSVTLQGVSGNASVSVQAGTHTISAPLILASNTSFNTATGTSLTVNFPISGPGSLTASGSGTLYLSAANSFTGGTVVSSGTLVATSASALPDGSSLTVGSSTAFD
jgi:glucuronoarabinoxylan endo-1,4-beta-xylanase